MTKETKEILDRVLKLADADKARLVHEILTSLDKPDEAIDAMWRKEVESRIEAHREGTMRAVPLEDVLAKYRK